MDPYGWAKLWGEYVTDRSKNGQFNYRQENLSGCGPEIELNLPSNPHRNFVSLVSNDYLAFTQYPKVKAAAIAAIEKYGSGAGASPGIGGHYLFHQEIENKIAKFFKMISGIMISKGYTANSSSLRALVKRKALQYWIWLFIYLYVKCPNTNMMRYN